jgi:cytochrome bd ubiquinol oxidase subunit II
MSMEPSSLALFWAGAVALSIFIYVIFDGFDLGIGVLFGMTNEEVERVQMMNSIAPFWDGNETWLVIIGASLFAAFPVVYAVFLSAFYLPVLLLLFGLIFRGVAFEFRNRAGSMRWFWDWGLCIGSVVVAFAQGAAIGAMMRGVPVVNNQYAGGPFGWLHPFPVLTGIGLVLGYALLGAGWLVLKSEEPLRAWTYARIPWLVGGVFIVLGLAFLVSITIDADAIAQSNLRDRHWGFAFPALAVAALVGVVASAAG